MTQETLADTLGVHRVTVARWESGERKIPEIAARMVGLVLAERRQLEKDVLALRAASDKGHPTTDLIDLASRVEKHLGAAGRVHAKALRQAARDRKDAGRRAAWKALTMILDTINPTKKAVE